VGSEMCIRDSFYQRSLAKGIQPTMARLTLARKIAAITLTLTKIPSAGFFSPRSNRGFIDLICHLLCFLHYIVKLPLQSSVEGSAGDSLF